MIELQKLNTKVEIIGPIDIENFCPACKGGGLQDYNVIGDGFKYPCIICNGTGIIIQSFFLNKKIFS